MSFLSMLFVAMGSSAGDDLTIAVPLPQTGGNFSNSWVFSNSSNGNHSIGQTITATNPNYLHLSSFSFQVSNFTPTSTNPTNYFRAYVYQWDSVAKRIVGPALYASNLLELTTQPNTGSNGINYTNVTVNTDIALSLNQEYALFFAALDGGLGSSYRLGTDRSNPYLDGSYITSTSTDFNNLFITDAWKNNPDWDLAFSLFFSNPPTAQDTFASMQNNASSLRQIFSLQSDALYDGLNYSCDYFNQNNTCISFVGKYNQTNESNNVDATSGIIKVAHKLSPNFYVGGFLEQIISDVDAQGVTYRQKAPDVGVYTGWTQNEDGGWQARLAYRHSNGQVSIQREALGTAEAGFGKTELNSDGYQFSIGNTIHVNNNTIVTPYIGIRYSEISRQSYSEHLTDDVTRPLYYDDLTQKTTTAFAGAKIDTPIFSKIALTGSLGVEKDLNNAINDYSATGIDNLDSILLNDPDDLRAVATIGANYNFSQNQQLGIQAAYREQSYGPSSTTSAYLSYTTSF